MASKEQITLMIASIKDIYPYYAKNGNSTSIAKLWFELLCEYPDEEVAPAFKQAVKICKHPPTPADVIEQINKRQVVNQIDVYELWSILDKALDKTAREMAYIRFPIVSRDYHQKQIRKIFDSLPESVRHYIGSASELMRLAEYDNEALKFEKNSFFKHIQVIESKNELKNSMMLSSSSTLYLDE